ncbi:MAG: rare lipoprotein [Actinoallomurus sp.]|nr:rare lipoprotein [Actinoallomurus sp.]
MGSSGRHRHTHGPKTFRISLIAATGLAVLTIVTTAVALSGSGFSSAQTRARAAPAPADSLRAPDRAPDRASRDRPRSPIATPSATPSETPSEKDAVPRKRHKKVEQILSRGACEASFYGSGGGTTASGEAFNPTALTAAHKTLPLGSKVRVTNRHNERSVVVRINDRGPFVAGRCLDLSAAAMRAVGGTGSGVIPVSYEVLASV